MDFIDKAILLHFANEYPQYKLVLNEDASYTLFHNDVAILLEEADRYPRSVLQRVMILMDQCRESKDSKIVEFKVEFAISKNSFFFVYGKGPKSNGPDNSGITAAFMDAGLTKGHLEGLAYYKTRDDLMHV